MQLNVFNKTFVSKQRARLPFAVFLTASSLLCASPAGDDGTGGGRQNVIYVQTNDFRSGQNSVIAYKTNNGNGCLQELGRFPTGGTGLYNFDDRIGPDDHAQELVIDRVNRRLLTVNSGSDSIAVFDIKPNGTLTPVSGSPFPSNGVQPVSIGLAANGVVYVVNQAGDPNRVLPGANPNYTGFRMQSNGALVPIANSTFSLPHLSFPAQALTRPDGNLLFGDVFLGRPFTPQLAPFLPAAGSFLDSFRIQPNGQLQQAPGSPVTPNVNAQAGLGIPDSRYVLGMWLHPTLPIVYATYVVTNRLAVYTYNPDGTLQFVQDLPIGPNDGSAVTVCWVIVSPDGRFIYTSNAGSNSISVFDISGTVMPASSPLSPVLIQVFRMTIPAGAGGAVPPAPIPGVFNSPTASFQIETDPEGKSFYAVAHELVPGNDYPQGNVVHSLTINQQNGTLSERACSPVQVTGIPAGAHPQGIAAY